MTTHNDPLLDFLEAAPIDDEPDDDLAATLAHQRTLIAALAGALENIVTCWEYGYVDREAMMDSMDELISVDARAALELVGKDGA